MELLISTAQDRAQVVPLADGKSIVIGRGTDADIRIDDSRASRKHCRIYVDEVIDPSIAKHESEMQRFSGR